MSADLVENMPHSVDLADACDVVVVGGGLVGSAVAARLARAGLSVAVLEARRLAGGATGRSLGLVLTGLPESYALVAAARGREWARDIWALTGEGRERLAESAVQLGVPFDRRGSLRVAMDEDDVQALSESAELLQEDGFDAWFGLRDPLERGFLAALRHPDDLTIDAAELAEALIESNEVTVHEGTEVRGFEAEGDGVRVWSKHRTVYCNKVVLAVDGYAALLDGYFADKVEPKRSLVWATQPLDGVVLEQPFCTQSGQEYGRQLPDHRLLVGAWLGPNEVDPATEIILGAESGDALNDRLSLFASRYVSELASERASRWSDFTGFTPDGLPLVGQLPDLPQVFFALGLGGHGLSWAFIVSERLAGLILDDAHPGILAAERLA